MTQKTIKISREIHRQLKEYGNGKSFNKVVRELLERSDNVATEHLMGEINFTLNEELIDALIDRKVYPSETYSSVLYRLLHQIE